MRYALAILGVCLALVGGALGTIHVNAKRHHTTWAWEYHRMVRAMGADRLGAWRGGGRADAVTGDLRRLTAGHQADLNRALAHGDRAADRPAPRASREQRLTGAMAGGD